MALDLSGIDIPVWNYDSDVFNVFIADDEGSIKRAVPTDWKEKMLSFIKPEYRNIERTTVVKRQPKMVKKDHALLARLAEQEREAKIKETNSDFIRVTEDDKVCKIQDADSPESASAINRGEAVRITYPWVKAEPIIRKWAEHCEKIVCYEHDDDGANNLHVHVVMEGMDVCKKRFQQLAKETGIPLTVKKKGNKKATSMMSFRLKEFDGHPSAYAYLTKGKYEPKYVMGYDKGDPDKWKASWVPSQGYEKQTNSVKRWNAFKPLFDEWLLNYPVLIQTQEMFDHEVYKWKTSKGESPYPEAVGYEYPRIIPTTKWMKMVNNYIWAKYHFKYDPQQNQERESLVVNIHNIYGFELPKDKNGNIFIKWNISIH